MSPMLPTPKIFRKRSAALLWAGGILWFAHDVAASQPQTPPANAAASASNETDATGAAVNDADLRTLAKAMPD